MFALPCIGSLGDLLPLAEYIHSSADEMLIWGPDMNVFDTSPYLVNTVLPNEPFVSLSIYPEPREAFILRSSLDLFILESAVHEYKSQDEGCVVLRAWISTDCHINAVETL